MIITYSRVLLFTLSLFSTGSLLAETVSIKLEKDINSVAQYQPGEADLPLLILLHGFLQTSSFSTVDRLFNALHDSGYPVLAPTLSLGISDRATALPCESIHLHSLESDTEEIARWVEWAVAHGHKDIVLIGHSAGSVNITAYLAKGVDPAVSKTILVSLTHYGPGRPAAFESEYFARRARAMLRAGDSGLSEFALAYCKTYVTTASDYLSYYDWSDKAVLDAIKVKGVKNYIIIGSADKRIEKSWVSQLQKSGAELKVVDGASHFFDQLHEFDLLESIENILEGD